MRQWTEHVVRFMSSVPVCIFLRHVKSTSLARQTKERRIANGRRTPIANRPTPPPLAGMKVIVAILALLGGTCDALRLPAGVTRRVAIGGALVPALFLPSAAVAKYRPSLAEFKGYGSSPMESVVMAMVTKRARQSWNMSRVTARGTQLKSP